MVCACGHRYQIIGELFHSIGADRVRTNHHTKVVALKEGIQVVRTKVHDVVLLLWVSYVVMLEPTHIFTFMGITPKQIYNFLMILYMV